MLIDTNVLIGIFKKSIPQKSIGDSELLRISGITYAEFLANPEFSNIEMKHYQKLLQETFIIEMITLPILFKSAQILNQKILKLGDALIVATAMECSEKLYTLDNRIIKKFPQITVRP